MDLGNWRPLVAAEDRNNYPMRTLLDVQLVWRPPFAVAGDRNVNQTYVTATAPLAGGAIRGGRGSQQFPVREHLRVAAVAVIFRDG